MMANLLVLILVVSFPGWAVSQEILPSPAPLIEEGDRHWDHRAEGAEGSRADTKEIDQAIADYRQAMTLDPESLVARGRLLRALYFKGEYTTQDREEKKRIFEEGKAVAEDALERIRAEASHRTGKSMTKAGPVELAPVMKDSRDALDCFLWGAANWGGWALAYGKLAAARQGVAGKIRDFAKAVIEMDPNHADGGGYRVLGRLHHQTPHIPFITGWVSSKEAIRYLRLANQVGPRYFLNRLYLAEAVWDQGNSASREEAIKITEELNNDTPRPDYLVEERAAQERAKALLEQWKKK